MGDSYSPVSFGRRSPFYLPDAIIKAEEDALIKAQRAASGKLFSNFSRFSQQSVGPGLDKPPDGLTFALLRLLATRSPIDRIIINTRMMQMRHVARQAIGRAGVGFAVRHVRDADEDFDVPEGIKKLAREVEEIIGRPMAPQHQHFRDFLTCATEEELILDRKAMVIVRNREGKPIKYYLLDGATIKPVVSVVFEEQRTALNSNGERITYEQAIERIGIRSGGIDLSDKAYVQVIDAQIVAAWRAEEMSVDITNSSVEVNRWGYGRSMLEQSWQISDAFLKAWNYNLELFKLNYPEAVLMVKGSTGINREGLDGFRRVVLGEDETNINWRMPVLPIDDPQADIKAVKLRDTPKDMMFAEFMQSLIRLKCAAFRMHPSLINFTVESSGSAIIQSNASQADQISASQEEGFHALVESMADWLSRTIAQEYHKDLRVVWIGLDKEAEETIISRLQTETQTYLTINEARTKRGLKKLPKGVPTEPGDFIGNYEQAVGIVTGQQQQQMDQQGDQQDQQGQYDQGDFGQGDDNKAGGGNWWEQAAKGEKQTNQPQKGGQQHPEEEEEQVRGPRVRPQTSPPDDLDDDPKRGIRKSRTATKTKFLRIRISE